MRSVQTTVGSEVLAKSRHEDDHDPVQHSIADIVLALEELVAITQQIAPYGTDARFDAWCSQYLINQPKKECPSDHEPDHHIAYI